MSELAFNANGEAFEVPATVTGWRVRRMKPRGAPELVYGSDGRPLTVPIEASIDDLREAVGTAGKYRLDGINDDGKCVEAVPPAYVQVVRQPRTSEPATLVGASSPSDDTIREAMRMNTELAKSVIDRFPEMMHAAAELLRAADGAGMPARQPRKLEVDEDEDDVVVPAPASSPMLELVNTLVGQIVPIVVTTLAGKKAPNLGAIFDWRKAAQAQLPTGTTASADAQEPLAEKTEALPPLDPNLMGHFIAIQAGLTPPEAALARQIAAELSPQEMRMWLAELSTLSVPDAVAKIRTFVGGKTTAGGPS